MLNSTTTTHGGRQWFKNKKHGRRFTNYKNFLRHCGQFKFNICCNYVSNLIFFNQNLLRVNQKITTLQIKTVTIKEKQY